MGRTLDVTDFDIHEFEQKPEALEAGGKERIGRKMQKDIEEAVKEENCQKRRALPLQ